MFSESGQRNGDLSARSDPKRPFEVRRRKFWAVQLQLSIGHCDVADDVGIVEGSGDGEIGVRRAAGRYATDEGAQHTQVEHSRDTDVERRRRFRDVRSPRRHDGVALGAPLEVVDRHPTVLEPETGRGATG